MKTFRFYQDAKHTVWQRNHFEVKAESYEQAVEKVKEYKNGEILTGCSEDFINGSTETLFETSELMTPDKNGGSATLEVYNEDGEYICDNTTE